MRGGLLALKLAHVRGVGEGAPPGVALKGGGPGGGCHPTRRGRCSSRPTAVSSGANGGGGGRGRARGLPPAAGALQRRVRGGREVGLGKQLEVPLALDPVRHRRDADELVVLPAATPRVAVEVHGLALPRARRRDARRDRLLALPVQAHGAGARGGQVGEGVAEAGDDDVIRAGGGNVEGVRPVGLGVERQLVRRRG